MGFKEHKMTRIEVNITEISEENAGSFGDHFSALCLDADGKGAFFETDPDSQKEDEVRDVYYVRDEVAANVLKHLDAKFIEREYQCKCTVSVRKLSDEEWKVAEAKIDEHEDQVWGRMEADIALSDELNAIEKAAKQKN